MEAIKRLTSVRSRDQACSPSTLEAEAGGSQVQSQLGLQNSKTLCQKQNKTKKKKKSNKQKRKEEKRENTCVWKPGPLPQNHVFG